MQKPAYRWFRLGDINAFFGLMGDNMSDLVIMAGILIGVFQFPADIVLYKMIPGTAIGVLIGDLVYTRMAIKLAKKTGRDDVTAMPLGLDTPSTFGLTFGVIGPAFLATKDAMLSWQIAMTVVVAMGVIKIIGAWIGPAIRRNVPRAGLLGSIAGIALVLIAFLPSLEVFANPVVGFVSFGIILMTLIAKVKFPFKIPGALAAVGFGTLIFYLLYLAGVIPAEKLHLSDSANFTLSFPLPTFGFLEGFSHALQYLPVAIPFAIAVIVGGVDVTESAAVAGDEYNTRDILLTDGIATIIAGMCGGVAQSTPYIGHPAYKDMGGRAGYTFATALFIGIGGLLGYLSFFVNLLPKAAVAPILIFIGMEITAQAFEATPRKHAKAIAFAFVPVIADLLLIEIGLLLGNLGKSAADLTGGFAETYHSIVILANGFIISSMLWGAAIAYIIDHKLHTAAFYFFAAAILSLFGIIHSPLDNGGLFLPWQINSSVPVTLFAGYLLAGLMMNYVSFHNKRFGG
ncbi:MAG: MFS transporter [Deltaproteobacteria bacterium RIFCSPLOWO2_12_FULL_43_16]|nr:MAG: MFS transporter [Deltaproteobacteria bacterium GWA2_43_19]OGQ11020.1 MAG: MFS transporter [Deltaproteobacteria bacterium RIFCSPHIGHO2_02_FULL_43_33]OGQ61853.1 MAG: MFS transporter [Deltaproteobacteria bacterium RIFCSPLOWO2_12_FULL_43_16]HBR16017.1 MFS transporter [Deltaproteobacteria bacterium]